MKFPVIAVVLTSVTISAAVLPLEAGAVTAKMERLLLRSNDGIELKIDYAISPRCQELTANGKTHLLRFAEPVTMTIKTKESDRILIETEFWGQFKSPVRPNGDADGPIFRLREHYDRVSLLNVSTPEGLKGRLGAFVIRDDNPATEESIRVFQTLRVTINGRPLIDPVNYTDRFKVSLDDGEPCGQVEK